MQAKVLGFALLASFGTAQDFPGQPQCATPCWESAVSQVGCSASDAACWCSSNNREAVASDAGSCLFTECNVGQVIEAQSAAASQCASIGAATATSDWFWPTNTASSTATPATASSVASQTSSLGAASTGGASSVLVAKDLLLVLAIGAIV